MTSPAVVTAVKRGIDPGKCILGGWGYDPFVGQSLAGIPHPANVGINTTRVVVLAFGVLRRDKRIHELIKLFLRLDDHRLLLRVVGKPVDVDVSQLRKLVGQSNSRSVVEILDGFVEDSKIQEVFGAAHVVVLSHAANFQSMSGPLFLAIQYGKPILCFSSNTVSSLVLEAKAGRVLLMDGDIEEIRHAILQLRHWEYDPAAVERFSWPSIATRMVDW